METAYICDAIRTPFGRYGGSLASIRADDLAAIPIAALMARNIGVDWAALDDVIYGCANQAGEDNRNVARMALLLAAGLFDGGEYLIEMASQHRAQQRALVREILIQSSHRNAGAFRDARGSQTLLADLEQNLNSSLENRVHAGGGTRLNR